MSGPYPPPGSPQQPDQGGWQYGAGQGAPYGSAPGGQYPPGGRPHDAVPGGQTGQYPPVPGGQPGGRPHDAVPGGQYGPGSGAGYPAQPGQFPPAGQFPPPPGSPPYGTPAQGFPAAPPPGSPPYGTPAQGFPAVPPGWGVPPPRPTGRGRRVAIWAAVLVVAAGAAVGGYLLVAQHGGSQAAPPAKAATASTSGAAAPRQQQPSQQPDPTGPNGQTGLALTAGSCVNAQAAAGNQYSIGHKATCGAPDSDLMLALTAGDLNGCADHQYLRVLSGTSVYCFTLDLKVGDCVDRNYLKVPCAAGTLTVLKTEPGPGGPSSCGDAAGATNWVPVGRGPVVVGCVGPTKTS